MIKISKHKGSPEESGEIILSLRTNDLGKLNCEDRVRAYARKRAKSQKELAILEQIERWRAVAFLDDEGTDGEALEKARRAGASLLPVLNEHGIETLVLSGPDIDSQLALAYAEGLALAAYQFLKYKTREALPNSLKEIRIDISGAGEAEVAELEHLTQAVYLSRNLVNEPLSYLTATRLSEEIRQMGAEAGFSVEVFNKKQIQSLKMGGLLAVNKGSVDPPTFSILEWKPDNAGNKKPIVLVGKGVVYDTGGLSLKPTPDSMDYMKCDMGGAAAVAGAFYAIARNKLPLWVIGLVPATDNRPDGNAYVPGDVITMHDQSTVEVLNTDAEGRMILADALSYAKQYEPELTIDLATLTGSAHMAIDKYGLVGMGNASRDIMEALKASGERCSERIAEFPFWDDYKEQLKSELADLKNIGTRNGGAITAGKFLEHFTNYPYIHLDIAGPAFNKMPFNYRGKGGSGVGVRLIYSFLKDLSQK